MSKLFEMARNFLREKIYLPAKRNLDNPQYIAMSFAAGAFFTLLPLFAQATLCFGAWLLMRRWAFFNFNAVIACTLTFLSNPLTDPFFFYAYYLLGVFLLGQKAYTFADFAQKFDDIAHLRGSFWSDFKSGADFVIEDVGQPIAVGSATATVAGTLVCYFAVLAAAKFAKRKREASEALKKAHTTSNLQTPQKRAN